MIHKEKIDWVEIKNIIYTYVDIPAAFNTALGFFHPTHRFKNPFRNDKHPDCSFFKDKKDSRIWLFHDFATGETYDIFRAFEVSQGLDFIEIVKMLAGYGNCMAQMNEKGLFLDSEQLSAESNMSASELIARLKQVKKEEKKLMDGIKTQAYEENRARLLEAQKLENWGKEKPVLKFEILSKFKQHHIDFWAKRFLEEKHILNTVVALDSVYTEKADGTRHIVFKDSPEQPLFGYIQEQWITDTQTDQVVQQIYRPYSESKQHKFRNIGSPLIWQKLEIWKDAKGLMIIKGFKDAIHLKYAFPEYLISGKLGEASKLPEEEMAKIDKCFPDKNYPIYIWVDNDAAGVKAGQSQEEYFKGLGYNNVRQVMVPNGKDVDDYVQLTNGDIITIFGLMDCLTFKNKI